MADTAYAAPPSERVAGSKQALLVVDDDCICLEASLGACRLLGAARSEVVGRPVADLLEADSRERFNHIWRAFRADGGHAEPFALEAPATMVEVGVTVTGGVLPSRHVIAFGPPHGIPLAAAAARGRVPNADGHGHRPANATISSVRGPTAREREVLGLLATGATDTQIAKLLELSPATVQTHVRNAKAKLGARTRAQAVAMALRRGLIDAR
jgi:DNA-binding CsgD family transcriptional regulator